MAIFAVGIVGSIPACAGEPFTRPSPRPRHRVYPRVCGGTRAVSLAAFVLTGLSPRVRGNPASNRASPSRSGSIPACAGEPAPVGGVEPQERVYPRVCGGTIRTPGGTRASSGLSPRVRGNRRWTPLSSPPRGSIPACAGEPTTPPSTSRPWGVYPRVCGGTGATRAEQATGQGLSPRVRGNQESGVRVVVEQGSIPACAGEPRRRCRRLATSRVYPRVCGGTLLIRRFALLAQGLSPRVRGNHLRLGGMGKLLGSIPACAGEPLLRHFPRQPYGVYPRVCGGTTSHTSLIDR